MATKGDHQTSLHSSIVLLQERFRQLQKNREMRQERELSHVLSISESERHSSSPPFPTTHNYPYQPSTLFSNSELIFQQKPSSQLGLSLWPDSQSKHANLGGLETENGTRTTTATQSWLMGTTLGHNSAAVVKFDDSSSDIDTSLHL